MSKLKSILKFGWNVCEIIIVLYVVLMTVFILMKNKYGFTQFRNYTLYNVDSIGQKNNSKLHKGDLVIIKKSNNIKIGDLIYYYAIHDESYIVRSDKVLDITKNGDDTLYTVHHDDDIAIFDNKVLGKDGLIYPHFGTFITIACSKLGFILLVLLPITLVFGYQVYDFIKLFRKERELDDNNDEDKKNKNDKEKDEDEDSEEEPEIKEVIEEDVEDKKDNDDKKPKEDKKDDEPVIIRDEEIL